MGGTPEFYVSTLIDSHSDVCMAVAKPSARQIQLLPTFDAATKGDKGIKRKSIVTLVQARDSTNLLQYRCEYIDPRMRWLMTWKENGNHLSLSLPHTWWS